MNFARRHTARPQEAGFTLVELLIVMSVILILITIAIPSYEKVHKSGNETSAIQSIKTINSMQALYNSTYPRQGFASNLLMLGGKQGSSAPSAESAQLLSDDLSGGVKSGYVFSITGVKTNVSGADMYSNYTLTAIPLSVGHSGNRGFCSDASGEIHFDPKGGTNCTELLQ